MLPMGACNLEVDVNGQEIFYVDKDVLAAFSDRFRKLFTESTGRSKRLKVIFHDFPGGAEGFELVARFCYNGKIAITPSNVVLLNCCAHYMKMDRDICGTVSLIHQTEKFLEGVGFWSWSELLLALKQIQDLPPSIYSTIILQKVLDRIVERLASPFITSAYPLSPEFSSCQTSCDSRSTDSVRNSYCQTTMLIEDLMFLNIEFVENVVGTMIVQEINHSTISTFLFGYQKSRIQGASQAEKLKITELVISMLSLLDISSLPCKGLFDILRVAICLKTSNPCKSKLESMIGSQLARANMDYLLIRSPPGKNCMYDIDLVLRLVKAFLCLGSDSLHFQQLTKVANLVDSFLTEVAPDSNLKPSKFAALVKVLPYFARESHDKIYKAMEIYFEVHAGMSEEEKMKICDLLNYEKLSEVALTDLANNSIFPPKVALNALNTKQSRSKSVLQDAWHLKTIDAVLHCRTTKAKLVKGEDAKNGLQAETLDRLTENEKIFLQLRTTHWRVTEADKISDETLSPMRIGDIVKSKAYFTRYIKSISKLCS